MTLPLTEPANWDGVFAGTLSDDEYRTVLSVSAGEIAEFLECDSETEEETLRVLAHRLAEPNGTQTYDQVMSSMKALMGDNGATLVHWYMLASDEERVRLDALAAPRVVWLLRRIAATHGPEMKACFTQWKEPADDWRVVNREIYFDVMHSRHYLRHQIVKVNGEEVRLEGNADSVLDLIRTLTVSLLWIGSVDAFSPAVLAAYFEQAREFERLVTPEAPSENGHTLET